MSYLYANKKPLWKSNLFNDVWDEIHTGIMVFGDRPDKSLQFIKEGINTHSDDLSTKGSMKGFIFCIRALLHEQKHATIGLSQSVQIADLAKSILVNQGIKPTGSSLSLHYGKLNYILSQIYGAAGHPLKAAWLQEKAALSYDKSSYDKGFSLLSRGQSLLRLGEGPKAAATLNEALTHLSPESEYYNRALFSLASYYCIIGDSQNLELCHQKTCSLGDDILQKETEWLSCWVLCRANHDYTPLMTKVLRKGSHANGVYILEAKLMSYAIEGHKWRTQLPKISSLMRSKKVHKKISGKVIQALKIFKDLYDEKIPLEIRIDDASKLLELSSRVLTVSEELLTASALTRWLERNNLTGLAKLSFSKYSGLSFKLTAGKDPDCLGFFRNSN